MKVKWYGKSLDVEKVDAEIRRLLYQYGKTVADNVVGRKTCDIKPKVKAFDIINGGRK